jgi:spore germination cell wall hydrolase CwlJ-like protein
MRLRHLAFIIGILLSGSVNAQNLPPITANFQTVEILRKNLPINIPEAENLSSLEIKELECLSWNLYFEARGGTQSEKIAVTWVPINRMTDPRFGSDICTNVFQYTFSNGQKTWQFSWVGMKFGRYWKIEAETWVKVQRLALGVYKGQIHDTGKGALFFHHVDVQTSWTPRSGKWRIGSHYFYR